MKTLEKNSYNEREEVETNTAFGEQSHEEKAEAEKEVSDVETDINLDNVIDPRTIEKSGSAYTANDVVKLFQNEGLSLLDLRDHTDKQCGEAASIGTEDHDHSVGFFTLRFNEPLSSEEEYKRVIIELVSN